MIEEIDDEQFEALLAQEQHNEISSILTTISEKVDVSPAIEKLTKVLAKLTEKETASNFPEIAESLKKSVDNLTAEVAKRNRPRSFQIIRKNGFMDKVKEVFE